MKTKHTPGPWRYRQPLAAAMRGQAVRSLEVLTEGPNGIYKPYIADVRSLDADGNDNTEANARLIAAAPDLLAALGACLTYLADLNGSEWIAGDGPGEADMRQRAKGLQRAAFKACKSARGE